MDLVTSGFYFDILELAYTLHTGNSGDYIFGGMCIFGLSVIRAASLYVFNQESGLKSRVTFKYTYEIYISYIV